MQKRRPDQRSIPVETAPAPRPSSIDPARPVIVVNPRSGRGLTERAWAKLLSPLREELGAFDVEFTRARGDATRIAREQAVARRKVIVAFGGDGTVSEVANGILEAGAGTETELAIIPRGTGGDFRRTLDLPLDLRNAAARARQAKPQVIDAGRATYTTPEGATATRYFVNVASFGFSSTVAARANDSAKRLGLKAAYFGATVRSLISYQNADICLTLDGERHQRGQMLLAAVGNGRFFGGGMKICPGAQLDSGDLELVVVGNMGKMEVLRHINRLYAGTHLTLEDVRCTRVKTVRAEPAEADVEIPVELDGETPGRLPATFEILPRALRVRF